MKENQKKELWNILKIVVGCLIYSLSVVLFLDPAQIIPGSVTGIGVVVKALTGFPIGALNFIINVPLVIWATIVLGKRILIYTGLTVLLTSVMMDGLAFLPAFTDDVLLASLIGGVVMGVGLGLILDGGGSTGGTTIIGHLATHKKPDLPMGNILLIGDFIIIVVGSIFLKDWDLMLYSLIDLYVCVVVINMVMYSYKKQNTSLILCKDPQKTREAIEAALPERVRVLEQNGTKLVVATMKRDVTEVQKIVEQTDPEAVCHSFEAAYRFGTMFAREK